MSVVEINEITGIATVSVTEVTTEVTVDDSAAAPSITVTTAAPPQIIEVGIIGPQGPAGTAENLSLSNLTDVNIVQKVNNSVLYYDASSTKFVANDVNTITNLTDGGNF